MAGYAYDPVSSRADFCSLWSRFFMVVFCLITCLMIGTAAALHLAPHQMRDVRSWADVTYQDHLQHHAVAVGQQADAAGAWAGDMYHDHLHGHMNAAGQWVQDAYQDHLEGHVAAASDWANEAYQQHLQGHVDAAHSWGSGVYQQHLKQHVDAAHAWASDAYRQHLQPHVHAVGNYFGASQDQILKPYECSATHEISQWSNAHKEWCCEHHDTGCSTTVTTTQPKKHYMWISVPVHPGKYDCAAGVQKWQAGWSHGKKKWCCSHKGIGCASGESFDCKAGLANSEDGWSSRKKLWCCLHEARGCHEQAPEVYNCDAGYANWREGWSSGKKEWCCENHQRGCHGDSMEHFDCKKDLQNWHEMWSGPKQAYCCKAYALGCPTAGPVLPEQLPEAAPVHTVTVVHHVAVPVPAPVTVVHHVGVPVPAPVPVHSAPVTVVHHVHMDTNALYDCAAGSSNWRSGWSEHKKGWCCRHQADMTYHQRDWCCSQLSLGCEEGHTASEQVVKDPYDCTAGFANWRAGWSNGKKQWCCKQYSRGC